MSRIYKPSVWIKDASSNPYSYADFIHESEVSADEAVLFFDEFNKNNGLYPLFVHDLGTDFDENSKCKTLEQFHLDTKIPYGDILNKLSKRLDAHQTTKVINAFCNKYNFLDETDIWRIDRILAECQLDNLHFNYSAFNPKITATGPDAKQSLEFLKEVLFDDSEYDLYDLTHKGNEVYTAKIKNK